MWMCRALQVTVPLVVGAGGLGFLTIQGCVLEKPTNVVTPRTAGVNHYCDFGEATDALYAMSISTDPAIFVISQDWCTPCRWLEVYLMTIGNESRKIHISHVDPSSQAVIDYANAVFGDQLTEQVVPSVIISNYMGEMLFSQGYNGRDKRFDSTSRIDGSQAGQITLNELF